jgi:hypothetical protein
MTRRVRGGKLGLTINLLLVALALNLTAAVALATDGWHANDDANDDPDGLHGSYAPWSGQHRSAWWDLDGVRSMDQVYDSNMVWPQSARDRFKQVPNSNYVHEVRATARLEAGDWYYTDLPTPNHNEDDAGWEENAQGYEEKELGWDYPSTQIPVNSARRVNTGFFETVLYNADLWGVSVWFDIEAELTRINPNTGSKWSPWHYDRLGYMKGCCTP